MASAVIRREGLLMLVSERLPHLNYKNNYTNYPGCAGSNPALTTKNKK